MPETEWLSADVRCAIRFAIRNTGWRYGRRLSAEDVDDLTQETLMHLFEQASEARSPKAYAGQAARNATVSFCRKRFAARRDERKTTSLGVLEHTLPSGTESLEQLLAKEELEAVISKWRQALSPRPFKAMYLRYLAGLSSTETGRTMGISRTAVDSLLYRARKRLARHGVPVSGRTPCE